MVKKALRYVRGTTGLMLTYKKSDTLGIEGYSDSDFAGDVDDRKSTSGYIFTLAKGAISWKSSKQSVTSSSTMYAEFVACYEASGAGHMAKEIRTRIESGRQHRKTTEIILRQRVSSILCS